jgi:hypothetical protein
MAVQTDYRVVQLDHMIMPQSGVQADEAGKHHPRVEVSYLALRHCYLLAAKLTCFMVLVRGNLNLFLFFLHTIQPKYGQDQ